MANLDQHQRKHQWTPAQTKLVLDVAGWHLLNCPPREGHSAFQCPTLPHSLHRDSSMRCCSDFLEDGWFLLNLPLTPFWNPLPLPF